MFLIPSISKSQCWVNILEHSPTEISFERQQQFTLKKYTEYNYLIESKNIAFIQYLYNKDQVEEYFFTSDSVCVGFIWIINYPEKEYKVLINAFSHLYIPVETNKWIVSPDNDCYIVSMKIEEICDGSRAFIFNLSYK